MEQITNRDELRVWLDALRQDTEADQQRTRHIAVSIGYRAAMRVFPRVLNDLTGPYANKKVNGQPMVYLWASLLVQISLADNAHVATRDLANFDEEIRGQVGLASVFDLVEANHQDISLSDWPLLVAKSVAASAVFEGAVNWGSFLTQTPMPGALWESVSADVCCVQPEGDSQMESIVHSLGPPLLDDWQRLKAYLKNRPVAEGWPFWIDWYQRVLDGQPQDWALLTQVAQIDEEHWRAGPSAVWAQIERLMDRRNLLTRLRELEAQLAQARAQDAALAHRSHNNPPELLDDVSVQLEQVAPQVEAALSSARSELDKSDPDPKALSAAGQQIKDALDSFDRWCGARAMILIDAFMKEAGSQIAKTLAFLIKAGALTAVAQWLLKLS